MRDRIIKLSEMNFEKLNVITLTESGGLMGEIVVILHSKVVLLAFKPLWHNPFLWNERPLVSSLATLVLQLI